MYLGTIYFFLAAIVGLYFYNNPLGHSRWFMMRRFINWFPLGMTYAFLCMGRYNIIVAKGALGTLMSKEDLGIIFGVGTWVYALSFLVNGPLIDKKLGGKTGMIISAVGASLANVALGVADLAHRRQTPEGEPRRQLFGCFMPSTCIFRASARCPSSRSRRIGSTCANAASSAPFSGR